MIVLLVLGYLRFTTFGSGPRKYVDCIKTIAVLQLAHIGQVIYLKINISSNKSGIPVISSSLVQTNHYARPLLETK